MRKSVVSTRFSGVSKRCTAVKVGLFSAAAAARLRLNVGVSVSNKNRFNHKKIASFHVVIAPSQCLSAKLNQSKANEVFGALPIFVTSQKLGAKSCSK
jgi:hypothetical protein